MKVDSLIWWNSKGWCLGNVTFISNITLSFNWLRFRLQMHWKNKRFVCNFIITAIENAIFCCPFVFIFSDDVWLCAESLTACYLNVLSFTLFNFLELLDWTFFAFIPRCWGNKHQFIIHKNYYSICQKWVNPESISTKKWEMAR